MIESEAHSELCQTSKVEYFAKIVNGFKKITTFKRNSVLEICFCEYIPTISKEHFLLLNICIDRNFHSLSAVRNSNNNKLIR